MKAGEDNPQAREEGKLYLLSTDGSSSLAGIPRMWGLEFHGKATAFTSPAFSFLDQMILLAPSFCHACVVHACSGQNHNEKLFGLKGNK